MVKEPAGQGAVVRSSNTVDNANTNRDQMRSITEKEYEEMRAGAKVLGADSSGDKVFQLTDGRVLKLFRVRNIISSAYLYPYSLRFVDNVFKLQKKGISTVEIIDVFKVKGIGKTAVMYNPLEGITVREIFHNKNKFNEAFAENLGAFIADLHERGIYFRSIHIGNIVQMPSGELGLIDVSDMKVQRRPLSFCKRFRNIPHIIRVKREFPGLYRKRDAFVRGYTKILNKSNRFKERVSIRLYRIFDKFARINALGDRREPGFREQWHLLKPKSRVG